MLSGVEKGLLSPTCTRLSCLSHPNPGPGKSGGQILLRPSILLIHACGVLLHTLTPINTLILSALRGVCSLLDPSLCTHTHAQMRKRPKSFHDILYMSVFVTPRTKQVIRARLDSSIHTVLSVCFQSASRLHSGWTPLIAARI